MVEVGHSVSSEGTCDDLGVDFDVNLKVMCWNVCGWSNLDGGQLGRGVDHTDIRSLVLNHYKPDVIGVVESWLRGDEEASFEGYKWFGNNRKSVHKRAVRGSGGVGVLVREPLLRYWSCELLDCDVEDVLWVKLSNVASGVDMVLAVCYIPPISSGREVCLEERWQCLSEQVSKYASLGTVLLCGDFNARCGCVEEVEGLGDRQSEDQVINEQGRALLDFTRSLGLCVANGRAGSGDFTCISSKGCSVVDYCLLFKDDLGVVLNFKVVTMTEFVDAFHADCIVERIPDHSALVWDLVLDGDVGCSGGEPEDTPGECFGNEFRYVVPDDYLCDRKRDIESIVDNLRSYEGDQAHMDSLYDQLTGLMFSGLHKVKCSLRTSRQKHRWFTKDLMNMRKTFHQSERAWLRTKDKEERKCKRMDYVASRRTYAN